MREPLWLVAPKGTELSDPVTLLSTKPYIRFQSAVPLANLIDTEISRMGVVTQDIAEIDTIGSILTCVRQGLGISVVPHVALQEPEDREIVRLPFGQPQVTRQIGIVERTTSPRTEIIARIHEVLAELCGELGVQRPATMKPAP